jgi:hypothetical protein
MSDQFYAPAALLLVSFEKELEWALESAWNGLKKKKILIFARSRKGFLDLIAWLLQYRLIPEQKLRLLLLMRNQSEYLLTTAH